MATILGVRVGGRQLHEIARKIKPLKMLTLLKFVQLNGGIVIQRFRLYANERFHCLSCCIPKRHRLNLC